MPQMEKTGNKKTRLFSCSEGTEAKKKKQHERGARQQYREYKQRSEREGQ